MQPTSPARSAHVVRVCGMPVLLAMVSAIGLLSALLGDGGWDVLSWIALGTPVATIAWHAAWPVLVWCKRTLTVCPYR